LGCVGYKRVVAGGAQVGWRSGFPLFEDGVSAALRVAGMTGRGVVEVMHAQGGREVEIATSVWER